MTSGKYSRRTPDYFPDNPSFLERRRLNDDIERAEDEFPRRIDEQDSSMETYESERGALFYE